MDKFSQIADTLETIPTELQNCPIFLNRFTPPSEMYAPIYYDSDCLVKICLKPNWGGFLIAMTVWDLLIVDLDKPNWSVDDVIRYINSSPCKSETFFIHRTANGYHLYLMSRTLRNCSPEAIIARIDLSGDVYHGTNSIYTGNSIRLNQKLNQDRSGFVSCYVAFVGTSNVDIDALRIYKKCVYFTDLFSQYTVASYPDDGSLRKLMVNLWTSCAKGFGAIQIIKTAPLLLDQDGKLTTQIAGDEARDYWRRLCRYKVSRSCKRSEIALAVDRIVRLNTLYQIIESNDRWAIGVHIQENLYFISYRDLLIVDYDSPSQLKILYEFCRYHKEYCFRAVKTGRGYHCFLTSHSLNYDSPEAFELLNRVGCDVMYIRNVIRRGFAVRLNAKTANDRYIEHARVVGTGIERYNLVSLYQKHLDLFNKYSKSVAEYNAPVLVTNQMLCETLAVLAT